MKKCPYCAEEIQDEATKCKHCGEVLNKNSYGVPHIEKKPITPVTIIGVILGLVALVGAGIWMFNDAKKGIERAEREGWGRKNNSSSYLNIRQDK